MPDSGGSSSRGRPTTSPAPIAVFGASGRTGQALVRQALGQGIPVRGLYRPASTPEPAEDLTVVTGNLQHAADVSRTLEGCRAVACVFGPHARAPEPFCARATATILSAMAAMGTRRLVCQTGAMIGDGAGMRTRAMEWFARRFAASRPVLAADRVEQEQLVMASDTDWLLVKPPRLCDRRDTRPVVFGVDVRVGMLSSIGRDALAAFCCLSWPARAITGAGSS